MDEANVAIFHARCRIGIGAAAVAFPGWGTRVMGVSRGADALAPLFARMLGGRDVVLGLGTVIALDRGKPVRGWIEGSALADAADCLACIRARESMPPAAFVAAAGLGGASAVLGALLSRRLDPPPPPRTGQPEAVATGHPPDSALGG